MSYNQTEPILPIAAQCASPDLCRRLIEKGAPEGSQFEWIESRDGGFSIRTRPQSAANLPEARGRFPAFSVAELFELLRRTGALARTRLNWSTVNGYYYLRFDRRSDDGDGIEASAADSALPDAIASLLIELADEGAIDLDSLVHPTNEE
jgi:hypothetical protein